MARSQQPKTPDQIFMWFYVESQQQRGPVSEEELQRLRFQGVVLPETLIWREGQANWLPYGTIFAVGSTPPPHVVLGPGQAACSQCGRAFSEGDVIRYGGIAVCAECKPVFVQKLKEGVAIDATALKYAGFGRRFGAKFLDGIIEQAVQLTIRFIFFPASFTDQSLPTVLIVSSSGLVFSLLYQGFFLGRFAATPGKMAVGIRVVRPDGSRISSLTAFLRPLAEIVSGLTLGVGYLMAAWDSEGRALHDRMCNTRVIQKS